VEHRGGEQRDEEDADHELRQPGQGEQPGLDDGVAPPAPVVRGDHRDAERDRDHHQRREQHQHQRVEDGGADQLGDRLLVGERGAHVPLEQAAEPVQVAHRQRLVQVQLRGDLGDPRLVGSEVPAEDRPDRVTERGRGDEHHHRDQPQREDREPDPAGQPQHPGDGTVLSTAAAQPPPAVRGVLRRQPWPTCPSS
jgi:hypothetical protein